MSVLLRRAICPACYKSERNGCAICAGCHQLKRIAVRSTGLCKHCYNNHLAPTALRAYIESYDSPHPYNNDLFHLLVNTIEWDKVDANTNRRLRTFGKFLQVTPLPKPLTWEAIETYLPPVPASNSRVPKFIRASLLDLGHRLAAQNMLETWESYVARRNALLPISHAPDEIHSLLQRYADWLWARKSRHSHVRKSLDTLSAFWNWCAARGVQSPSEVQAGLVNEYLLSLRWQWTCASCSGSFPCPAQARRPPKACPQCHAIGTVEKTRRYSQNTFRRFRATLLVFFDWAKTAHLVLANPVHRKTPAPPPTIEHYPVEVINQLLAYAASADADPAPALMLYLILLHGLSVWELQHARLPHISVLQAAVSPPGLAEMYFILVPKQEPSLGDRSPGRPGPHDRLDFHDHAAPWLKPLLIRFEQDRIERVKNPSNGYVFVSQGRARHDVPVSPAFIATLIRDISSRVLGAVCTPNLLRKTTGIYLADRSGPGTLVWMGWDEQQAFAYSWASREIIRPESAVQPTNTG